jgi:glutamyl-tRNA synthetase
MSIRVRFAPSPTGFLHIGSLRTALFTYLLAKAGGGSCILRIEDTDQKREVEGATESLIDILKWVGIEFDEGPHVGGNYGPYIQTQRLGIYEKYGRQLLEKGNAYRCFCTAERLEQMRAEQVAAKMAPRYDGKCRNLSEAEVKQKMESGEKFVIRQKMPLAGDIVVHDALRGDITFSAHILDDHVLIKSNGVPTYQFASVVDDHLMEITHVTRAEEWLPSFPKNVLLYKAFDWEPPEFVHYPVILNKGGGKLSKRHGDVMVEDYRKNGYLPEALVNFCVLLGWNPKNDNELLSMEELKNVFSVQGMGTSGAVFDIDKLDYFNGYYIRQKSLDGLLDLSLPYLQEAGLVQPAGDGKFEICASGRVVDRAYMKAVLQLEQERIKKVSQVTDLAGIFFSDAPSYEPEILVWKKMTAEEALSSLKTVKSLMTDVADSGWTHKGIEEVMACYIESNKVPAGNYLWPFRVALTGRKASPGVFEVAEILGKQECLSRIEKAISLLA